MIFFVLMFAAFARGGHVHEMEVRIMKLFTF